jgi:hypothetical protein
VVCGFGVGEGVVLGVRGFGARGVGEGVVGGGSGGGGAGAAERGAGAEEDALGGVGGEHVEGLGQLGAEGEVLRGEVEEVEKEGGQGGELEGGFGFALVGIGRGQEAGAVGMLGGGAALVHHAGGGEHGLGDDEALALDHAEPTAVEVGLAGALRSPGGHRGRFTPRRGARGRRGRRARCG